MLLLGPRGSGKSSLVDLVLNEAKEKCRDDINCLAIEYNLCNGTSTFKLCPIGSNLITKNDFRFHWPYDEYPHIERSNILFNCTGSYVKPNEQGS